MRRTTISILIIIPAIFFLIGCLPKKKVSKPVISAYKTSDFSQEAEPVNRENMRHASSLWFEDNHGNWLYTDHKARTFNDVITVKILEESVAKSKATFEQLMSG